MSGQRLGAKEPKAEDKPTNTDWLKEPANNRMKRGLPPEGRKQRKSEKLLCRLAKPVTWRSSEMRESCREPKKPEPKNQSQIQS